MSTELIRRLMDAAESVEHLDDPDRDFVDAGVALLALAISRLDPAEREETLQAIEDGNALRLAVNMFPGTRQPPEVPCGHLN